MSNYRTANQAYYASRQPLNIKGLKEGRKNPKPNPSYKQIATDAISSSDKYYASAKVAPVQPSFKSTIKSVTLNIDANTYILESIVAGFMDGATTIVVKGPSELFNSARSAVDLAVGRNTLTRDQADAVIFVATNPVVVPDVVEEPVVEAEPVQPDEQAFLHEATILEAGPEESELLSAEVKTRRRRKKDEVG